MTASRVSSAQEVPADDEVEGIGMEWRWWAVGFDVKPMHGFPLFLQANFG